VLPVEGAPVVDCGSVLLAAELDCGSAAGEDGGCAVVAAAAAADGSLEGLDAVEALDALGVAPWPDIALANAVMCVRTSISLFFVVSSSAVSCLPLVLLRPVVPVVPLDSAPVVAEPALASVPISSLRVLSMAATWVLQEDLASADFPLADPDADALPAADLSSALMCRRSSAIFDLARAGTDPVSTSSSAVLAF
jgi:hypothetical protein